MQRGLRVTSLLVTFALTTCAPTREEAVAAQVGVRRDAVPIAVNAPVVIGRSNAELGSYLTDCDGEFMAGGTTGEVWPQSNGMFGTIGPLAPSAEVLTCESLNGAHLYMAAGGTGWFRYEDLPSFMWLQVDSSEVLAIDRRPGDDVWLVAFARGVELLNPMGLVGSVNTNAIGVRWAPGGQQFVLVRGNNATLYDFGMTGQTAVVRTFSPPSSRGFSGEVTMGELNPTTGYELAFGLTPGGVAVYSSTSPMPMYVIGAGRSVTYEEAGYGTLDTLLIGDPAANVVTRWLGDAAIDEYRSDSDGGDVAFGWSVAAHLNELAVGAPKYAANSGAVFLVPLTLPTPPGQEVVCTVGTPCSPRTAIPGTCPLGDCLGGVWCQPNANLTCPLCLNGVCVFDPDGGTIDAGFVDAGLEDAGLDGGEEDAGATSDAGTDGGRPKDGGVDDEDAGVEKNPPNKDFDAIACSSCASVTGGEVLLIAAGAWLLNRRKRFSSAEAGRARVHEEEVAERHDARIGPPR